MVVDKVQTSYKKLSSHDMNKWKSFPCTNKNLIVENNKKSFCTMNLENHWDIDERDCKNLNLDSKHKKKFYKYDIGQEEENYYPDNDDKNDNDNNDDDNDDDDERCFYDKNTVNNDNDDFEEFNTYVIDSQIYKKSLYS